MWNKKVVVGVVGSIAAVVSVGFVVFLQPVLAQQGRPRPVAPGYRVGPTTNPGNAPTTVTSPDTQVGNQPLNPRQFPGANPRFLRYKAQEPSNQFVYDSLTHLENARQSLISGAHDYGGHRAKALRITVQAIRQVERAITFHRKHDPND